MLLVVFRVGQATNRRHAGALEGELPLRGQLHHHLFVELAQNGAEGAGGMDQVAHLAGVLLQTMNACAHGQSAQWIGIAFVGTHYGIIQKKKIILA